jgi:hypothetical protein
MHFFNDSRRDISTIGVDGFDYKTSKLRCPFNSMSNEQLLFA